MTEDEITHIMETVAFGDAKTPDDTESGGVPDLKSSVELGTIQFPDDASPEPTSDNATPTADGSAMLSFQNGSFTASLPDGYYCLSATQNSEADIAQSDVSEEQLKQLLAINNLEALLIPQGESLTVDGIGEIHIRIKEKSEYEGYDFDAMSDDDLNAYSVVLVSGFMLKSGTKLLQIVRTGALPFVKFRSGTDELRYATIKNGKMLYIFATYEGEEVPAELEAAMELIVQTLRPSVQ